MATFELSINGKNTGVRVNKADTFFSKTLGLMGKETADPGLLITRCTSIHTFFMKTAIDAVFIDAKGRAVELIARLRPWRIVLPVRGASEVLELEPGTILKFILKKNDVLTLVRPGQ